MFKFSGNYLSVSQEKAKIHARRPTGGFTRSIIESYGMMESRPRLSDDSPHNAYHSNDYQQLLEMLPAAAF